VYILLYVVGLQGGLFIMEPQRLADGISFIGSVNPLKAPTNLSWN